MTHPESRPRGETERRGKGQPKLTLEKAALLMFGLGTAALMGIPKLGDGHTTRGPVEGLVRSANGAGLAHAEVALFDDATLSIVEVTSTDEAGRFVFHQEPERYHVFATEGQTGEAGENRTHVAGWELDRQRNAHGGVEIKLRLGHPARVRVEDAEGAPVSGAEVRVLDTSGTAVVVERLLTDADGEATFLAPRAASFGVFPPDGAPVSWMLDPELPTPGAASVDEEPAEFTVRLHPPGVVEGYVTNAKGHALGDVIVSAWDLDGEHWSGWTKTDEAGEFRLAADPEATLLRVVDPSRGYLSTEVRISEPLRSRLIVRLPAGGDFEVLAGTGDGAGAARVWVWSEETRTWGWGQLTDAEGRVRTTGSQQLGVVAVPLDESRPRLEAWGVERGDSVLQLER